MVVVAVAGGSRAYAEWAAKHIKNARMASIMTAILGIVVFVDDYFNCLTVGAVMSPVTDKFRVSHEKLAYIIDSTAAPVCIIAPVYSLQLLCVDYDCVCFCTLCSRQGLLFYGQGPARLRSPYI